MIAYTQLDAGALPERMAAQIPDDLRTKVVVIGSIATAWAFRELSGTASVATKDIDLILRPAIDAVTTATQLGGDLLASGWTPQFPAGQKPAESNTPDDALPALRLAPPDVKDAWFVELLAEPLPKQTARKQWRRFPTPAGDFGLPSFRYIPVAIRNPQTTPSGLRVAIPSQMALAHLLEHAEPDRTPISSLLGPPPRFTKDVGRAVALWWLANQEAPDAEFRWRRDWNNTLTEMYPGREVALRPRRLARTREDFELRRCDWVCNQQ